VVLVKLFARSDRVSAHRHTNWRPRHAGIQ
jgi:hypothetical protein